MAGRLELERWSVKPGLLRLASQTSFKTTRLERTKSDKSDTGMASAVSLFVLTYIIKICTI